MNHYESDEITRVKDRQAIDRILALEPRELYDTVRNESISMCGYGATVAMLTAVRALGATHAELVRYATSGRCERRFAGSRRLRGNRHHVSSVPELFPSSTFLVNRAGTFLHLFQETVS